MTTTLSKHVLLSAGPIACAAALGLTLASSAAPAVVQLTSANLGSPTRAQILAGTWSVDNFAGYAGLNIDITFTGDIDNVSAPGQSASIDTYFRNSISENTSRSTYSNSWSFSFSRTNGDFNVSQIRFASPNNLFSRNTAGSGGIFRETVTLNVGGAVWSTYGADNPLGDASEQVRTGLGTSTATFRAPAGPDGVNYDTGGFFAESSLTSGILSASYTYSVYRDINFNPNLDTSTQPFQVFITVDSVPAPGAIALLGVAGLVGRRRRN